MSVRGILVDVKNRIVSEKTLDGSLNGYYEALDCDCFDIPTRLIAGKAFSIYCDDEALLKDSPIYSAFDPDTYNVELFGNLFICLTDDEGETVGLDDDDCKRVLDEVRWISDNDGKLHPVVPVSW